MKPFQLGIFLDLILWANLSQKEVDHFPHLTKLRFRKNKKYKKKKNKKNSRLPISSLLL